MIKTLMRYLNHYDNINLISISKINYFILIQISTDKLIKSRQKCDSGSTMPQAVFCDRRIIMFS